jgi:S-adenosylmethionine:tRNA ribosyltransferase-isomerase
LDRKSGAITHAIFRDIDQFLNPGDLLVLNETRVMLARLFARKVPTGGRVELLLLNRRDLTIWEVWVGGKGLVAGRRIQVESGPGGEVLKVLDGPRRVIAFDEPLEPYLPQAGHVPLPPYIHEPMARPERYQTVYAKYPGSAAAPTAGLHFTRKLIQDLKGRGIGFCSVTLHIGLDTFAPVTEGDPHQHHIHTEWCQVTSEAASAIVRARSAGGRVVAVGTTSVRTLETAARSASPEEAVAPLVGPTDLFILPGFEFAVVDALITNFHLPRSTLLMLVSAFAGRETILKAYQVAKAEGYRFYSFGDAMLIL